MKVKCTALLLCAAALLSGYSAAAQTGTLDSDFDGDGIRIDSFDNNTTDIANAVKVLPDNKVIVAGTAEIQGDKDIAILKYNIDGSPDVTFRGTGRASINLGTGFNDFATSMAIQPDGKILIGGYTDNGGSGTNSLVVLRLRPDGQPDSTFGTYGQVTYPTTSATSYYAMVAVNNTTGTIALGGATSGVLSVCQMHADGTPDLAFGTAGVATITPAAGHYYTVTGLAYGPDGRLVAAGQYYGSGDQQFYAIKLLTDGTPDLSFSVDGFVATSFTPTSHDDAYSLIVQPDGKIVIGGYSNDGSQYNFAVLRYNTDGTLDLSLAGTGKKVITGSGNTYVLGMALASDGQYLLGGLANTPAGSRYAVLRLRADGVVDSTFGTDGLTLTNVRNGSFQQANAIAQAPDGRIVQTGGAGTTISSANFATVRYLSGLHVGIQDLSTAPQGTLIYPVPLQHTETLRYTLAGDERVTIALYTIDGRLIQQLLTGQPRTAGPQAETLQIDDALPAGEYILRLSTGTASCSISVVK